MLRKLR